MAKEAGGQNEILETWQNICWLDGGSHLEKDRSRKEKERRRKILEDEGKGSRLVLSVYFGQQEHESVEGESKEANEKKGNRKGINEKQSCTRT